MRTLQRLEKLVERFIESPFERWFKTGLHPADLAKALAAAMEQAQIDDGRGGFIAPNYYQVGLNQADYDRLLKNTSVKEESAAIQRYLTGLMAETSCAAAGTLRVTIEPRASLASGKIDITAEHLSSPQTPDTEHDTTKIAATTLSPEQWQLCLPDSIIRLGMPIIRLGRDASNDIVLPDETVSRYHAQLRWQNGQYHAKNLSRSQPLGLNSQPVQGSQPLKSGDKLQLGRVTLRLEVTP